MDRIHHPTAAALPPPVDPHPTPGFPTEGNPAAGTEATVLTAWTGHMLIEEMRGVVTRAGVAPSKADLTQLRQAMDRLYGGGQRNVTTNTTLTADDAGLVLVDAAGGNRTITLPAANAAGGRPIDLRLVRSDGSANTVTIQRAGADTIEGATSLTLGVGHRVAVCSDGGTTWRLMARRGDLVAPLRAASALGLSVQANFNQSVNVSFTAPADGTVLATGIVNISPTGAAPIAADLTIAGQSVSADSLVTPQSHIGVRSVVAGQSVNVALTVSSGATAPNVTTTFRVASLFVPAT